MLIVFKKQLVWLLKFVKKNLDLNLEIGILEYLNTQQKKNEEGHIKEYFYNPNSSSYREITKNILYFNELVQKGLTIEEEQSE